MPQPLIPQHIDDAEQMLHLGLRQGGGGLVKDNDLGVVGHGLGDLHHLPLRDGHGGHDGLGVYVDVQVIENLLGVAGYMFSSLTHDAAPILG